MAADLSEISVRSTYVYFGALKCMVIKPTQICTKHIIVNVKDLRNNQRLSIMIAFKHINKALIGSSASECSLVLSVNKFCARRIREALEVSSAREALLTLDETYFEPDSMRRCQRYVIVDIKSCGEQGLVAIRTLLLEVQRLKITEKVNSSAMGQSNITNIQPDDFTGAMNAAEYSEVMRELSVVNNRSVQETNSAVTSRASVNRNKQDLLLNTSNNEQFRRTVGHVNVSRRQLAEMERAAAVQMSKSNHTARPTSPPILAVPLAVMQPPRQKRPTFQPPIQQQPSQFLPQTLRPVIVQHHQPLIQQTRPLAVVSVPIVQTAYRVDRRTPVVPSSSFSLTEEASAIRVRSGNTSEAHQPLQSSAVNKDEKVAVQPAIKVSPSRPASANSTNGATNSKPTGSSYNEKNGRMTRTATKRVVHIDDAELATSPKKMALSDFALLQYPLGQRGAVTLHCADLDYLKPEGMLNDTIIDFYMKYIHNERIPSERRSSVFILNTFFYSKLTMTVRSTLTVPNAARIQQNFKSIRKWTSGVDLFSMDYIVVPINEELHWYMAIIAFPRAALVDSSTGNRLPSNGGDCESTSAGPLNIPLPKGTRKAQIIVFDSFVDDAETKRRNVGFVLSEYLECEYNDKRKEKAPSGETFSKRHIEKIMPREIPQQENYTDCGLFMLKYAECFLKDPPSFVTGSDSFSRWYPRFSIKDMREEIIATVKSLSGEEKWQVYEEYCRNIGPQPSQSSFYLPPTRLPTSLPRRRSFSGGDHSRSAINGKRKRSYSR